MKWCLVIMFTVLIGSTIGCCTHRPMNIQVVDQRLESNPRYQAVVKAVHRYQQALVAERKKNIEQAQKSVALANAAKNLMVAIGNSTNMTQVRQILAQYGYTEDQQGKEGHKAQKAKD